MAYAFWNNGAPIRARVRGGGHRQHLKMPDGTVRMGRILPDPAADLYAFAETGLTPQSFQVSGQTVYSNDGWVIHAERSATWLPVADIRTRRIAAVNGAANAMLAASDWYVMRGIEDAGKPVPAEISNYRTAVRQASNDFVAAIEVETDPQAAATLQPLWPTAPAVLNT